MGRIVVGVDGSRESAAALRWAVDEGEARGWEVVALMAWGLLDQHHPGGEEEFDPRYGEEQAMAALESYIADALGDAAGRVKPGVVADLPAHALLAASEEADLLVVGARGLGGFKGLLLGSVSQKAALHSACPVVIVRTAD